MFDEYHANEAILAEAMINAEAEGMAKGMAEGKAEVKAEVAKGLLANGKLSAEEISAVSGIPLEEIQKMR